MGPDGAETRQQEGVRGHVGGCKKETLVFGLASALRFPFPPREMQLRLVQDVLRVIFETAARADRRAALQLCLVNKTAQRWIERILYNTVRLRLQRTTDNFLRTVTATDKYAKHVKSLCILYDIRPADLVAVVGACGLIESITSWFLPTRPALGAAPLRRPPGPLAAFMGALRPKHLSSWHGVLTAPDPRLDLPFFSQVTHLTVVNVWEEWCAWPWPPGALPALTHLSLDFTFGARTLSTQEIARMGDAVTTILAACPALGGVWPADRPAGERGERGGGGGVFRQTGRDAGAAVPQPRAVPDPRGPLPLRAPLLGRPRQRRPRHRPRQPPRPPHTHHKPPRAVYTSTDPLYLVAQGWAGAGSALRHGALARPLAIPQKRTLAGVGKDRDEAFPFWDHLFSAAAKAITIALAESDDEEGDNTAARPALHRTATGILSNRRPAISLSSDSGATTPDPPDDASQQRFSLLVTAKRAAARKGLYARFFRGPVLGPDTESVVGEEEGTQHTDVEAEEKAARRRAKREAKAQKRLAREEKEKKRKRGRDVDGAPDLEKKEKKIKKRRRDEEGITLGGGAADSTNLDVAPPTTEKKEKTKKRRRDAEGITLGGGAADSTKKTKKKRKREEEGDDEAKRRQDPEKKKRRKSSDG
ncbi:hypothetical protein MIND_00841000 [Mycena indigotica]|uniref:Uncharacterized protein n=1 Tax=Mycena indigotica TaxID=2126181 RepID=A0A8H6SJE0_9AGAR|nr:uncharacterized protein MIND_00841000 [Mycena indigotica]KAF7298930.1 hypothetical protein MIND_00841000 [Mycena indigotica]